MHLRVFGVALAFTIVSCGNNANDNSTRERELLLKERELQLQQRELDLKRLQDSLSNTPAGSLADQYEEVKDAVFLIYTAGNDDVAQGSAFVINKEGVAISNYHVFEDASDAIAVNSNGDEFIIDEIYTYSKTNDFIIFKLDRSGAGEFKCVRIAEGLPRIGEDCFAIGNPKGLTQTLSKGIISSYREEQKMIQTTAEITHGSSGGALFNSNGEVIGITSSGVGEADLNFAINVKTLPLEKYLSADFMPGVKDNISDYQLIKIKDAVAKYYDVYEQGDYDMLTTLFSGRVKRFHSMYNTTPEQAVASARQYDKLKGIKIVYAHINWDKFYAVESGDGFYINFPLDYKISRKETDKPTEFKINMTFELDKDYKINTIYEDILAKE